MEIVSRRSSLFAKYHGGNEASPRKFFLAFLSRWTIAAVCAREFARQRCPIYTHVCLGSSRNICYTEGLVNNEIDKLGGGINRRIHLDTYSSISFFSFLFLCLLFGSLTEFDVCIGYIDERERGILSSFLFFSTIITEFELLFVIFSAGMRNE